MNYFNLLPKELIEEIIYYVHVIDLSKFLYALKTLSIYNYKTNNFLWDNYVIKTKYKFVGASEFKLDFINFHKDINYKEVYNYLVLKEEYIMFWNHTNKDSTFENIFKGAIHNYHFDIIKFLLKHDEIELIGPINIINDEYIVMLFLIHKNKIMKDIILYILLHKRFRNKGCLYFLPGISMILNNKDNLDMKEKYLFD